MIVHPEDPAQQELTGEFKKYKKRKYFIVKNISPHREFALGLHQYMGNHPFCKKSLIKCSQLGNLFVYLVRESHS